MSYSSPAGYGAPPQQYGAPPPQQYGAPPQGQYGAPPPQQYGQAPPQQYGSPPPQQYGGAPPPQQYGAPQQQSYGGAPPPQQMQPQGQPYGAPPPPAGIDPNVAAWFNSIDSDRNGQLDARELQRALQLGHLNFDLSDVDKMVKAFDANGSRTLNVQEFCKLHEFITSVTGSYNYFDQSKRGLGRDGLAQALRHAGFALDPPVMQAMVKRHDPNNDGLMQLAEYIRMCLFLQSCVRTFGAFDSQRTGRITLDFNQFVYGASHLA